MNLRKTNDYDLTEDEINLLRGSGTPEDVKHYLSRQHENIGRKVTAYRKVAAAAAAEREAIIQVRALAIIKGEASAADEARREAELERQKREAIETTLIQRERQIEHLTSERALAVHSE